MKITGRKLRKGMTIVGPNGTRRNIKSVTDKGKYMWVEYTEYDAKSGAHRGTWAESFRADKEYTTV